MNLRSLESRLIADWRNAWKFLSMWMFVLLGLAPELHTAVVAMGWLDDPETPSGLKWSLRILAVAGIAFRLARQSKPAPPK